MSLLIQKIETDSVFVTISRVRVTPVEIVVLTNNGLMADLSLSGTKVTPLDI